MPMPAFVAQHNCRLEQQLLEQLTPPKATGLELTEMQRATLSLASLWRLLSAATLGHYVQH
eukprot:SAG31_NODE_2497_length_5598_cov_3.904710_2_plen_61_part_00